VTHGDSNIPKTFDKGIKTYIDGNGLRLVEGCCFLNIVFLFQ
jgi:hypothetical protein